MTAAKTILRDIPVIKISDVTEEIMEEAWSIIEGWYSEGPIDWGNVWDRMEQGGRYNFGTELDSPAMRAIRREMLARRREN